MKNKILTIAALLYAQYSFSQNTLIDSANFTYLDLITINHLNGTQIFENDSIKAAVENVIKSKKITVPDKSRYYKVYYLNKESDKYLKIWGAPDYGYGYFFNIGYTKDQKFVDCAYLGRTETNNFIVTNNISLGESLKTIWPKAHLEYFRRFKYNNYTYFYFEKGMKQEVPFTPGFQYYYKFDNKEKLVEFGFGYGLIGENPMFQ